MLLKPYSQVSKLVTILEASYAFTCKYQEIIERPTEFHQEANIHTRRHCLDAIFNLLITQNLDTQVCAKPNTKKKKGTRRFL